MQNRDLLYNLLGIQLATVELKTAYAKERAFELLGISIGKIIPRRIHIASRAHNNATIYVEKRNVFLNRIVRL